MIHAGIRGWKPLCELTNVYFFLYSIKLYRLSLIWSAFPSFCLSVFPSAILDVDPLLFGDPIQAEPLGAAAMPSLMLLKNHFINVIYWSIQCQLWMRQHK